MSTPDLSMFFVVDPPRYQDMGCYLAASIRTHLDEDVDLIGYCPADTIKDMDPYALAIFKKLKVDIRPMDTQGAFDPPYPHGNKMIAAAQPRRTPYSAFLDSDILFIGATRVADLIKPGHVSLTPAASMYWSGQKIWKDIYAACEMPMPADRIWLARQRRRKLMPYFSAGFFVFPEGPANDANESFVDVWMRLARMIDKVDIIKKRPYLDQMSLPLAIHAFCRNTLGPRVAVIALAIACFWPDFLLFAAKPMPDALSTYTIFIALAMASGGGGRARLIGVGFLAGLTIILRYQMLPFIGAFGLYYMYTLGARAIWPVLGLLMGLLLGGAIDAVTWWGPFSSFVENFRLNITYKISELFGKSSVLFYAGYFAINTLGLALPGLIGLALAWRRLWPYLLAAAIGFVAMHIPAHKEYRFLFWLLPFGVVGLAYLLHWLLEQTGARASMARLAGVGLGAWIAMASLVISVGYLDRAPYDSPVYAGRCGDAIQATRFLSAREGVTGIYGGAGYSWWCAGGYYNLGRNIPIYPFQWHPDLREAVVANPGRFVSHWVSFGDDAPAGWPEIARFGDFAVSENPTPPATPIFPKGWTYAAPLPKGVGDIPVSGEIRFP